jgi:hypothetical protein
MTQEYIHVRIPNPSTREKLVFGYHPDKPAYEAVPRERFIFLADVGVEAGGRRVKVFHGDHYGQGMLPIHRAREEARKLATELQERGFRAGVIVGEYRASRGRDWYGRTFYQAWQDFHVWASVDGPVSPWPDEDSRTFWDKYMKPVFSGGRP